ncbi:hypothetical protein ACM55G_12170 [Flavobacterium sp. LB3P122]|uniref:hypothetical protein n=1 Tax=Flavobacterium algoriphilum TaxID=3398738 RepID=UPI003A87689D
MTETLEYKISKYLSENDNGIYIDISFLSENKNLMLQKSIELKKAGYLTFYPTTRIGSSTRLQVPDCKIQLAGKKFLSEIELKNNNITNQFNNSTISQLNQDSDFFKSPNSIKTKAAPSNNPVIKSRLNTILLNPWLIGISFALIAAIFNGKRFMSFINNILDNF